jgi:hypothetical protein
MNKKKLNSILNYVKYGAMILFIFFLGYVVFYEQNNFCVTVSGEDYLVDLNDRGEKCFKTIGESNAFKLYLIEKYDIGKEKEIFLP